MSLDRQIRQAAGKIGGSRKKGEIMNIKELQATLKPCPFCGGRAAIFPGIDNDWLAACVDNKCVVEVATYECETPFAARDAWNKRIGETDDTDKNKTL